MEEISGSPENTESGSPTPISFAAGGIGAGGAISAPPPSGPLGGGWDGRKKRGRPRKYDAEGNLNPAYAAAAARRAAAAVAVAEAAAAAGQPPGFSLTTSNVVSPKTTSSSYEFGGSNSKRGRGKSSSSANWQQLGPCSPISEILADTAGAEFTPHVITVQKGEDVAAKIHAVGHKVPRGICVLSANGSISNVTIRQPGSSGGLLTYEGRFEILSLSGSYTISEAGGITSKTGGLSITLAGPDGRVVGGGVAGWMIAANPIQVVVGSFVLNGQKVQKRKYHRESHATSMAPGHDTTHAEIPNSQPMLHYHEAGPPSVSPVPAHSQSEADDSIGSGHNLNVVSSHDMQEWNNGSEPHRLYPDINVSVPGV
ncbi:hypothetical protein vseg_010764 [Gypsophila vaccaria]